MALFFSYVLTLLACLLAIPVFVFFVEIIAGLLSRADDTVDPSRNAPRKPVAVLVPAHNESAGIRSTLDSIKPQLLVGDQLLVVADNCADDTAAEAAAAGAEVIVRNDPAALGKGYALDFGLRHLSLDPRAIAIFIDADCKAAEGAIDQLAIACATANRPVQALYLMSAPDESPVKYHVAEFAWRVKNWSRPLGLNRLGLPCQLMGSGMAFPWELIRTANLAHGSIVEDMKLGLELAEAGHRPLFYPAARITSCFPWSIEGAESQRRRWEEGHIAMILSAMPYFYRAICRRNVGLLALTFDLIIPPLALLVLLVTAMLLIGGVAALLGAGTVALLITIVSFLTLVGSVFLAWVKHGRDVLPIGNLFSVAAYVAAKLPMYSHIFSGHAATRWIRTDRMDSTGVSTRRQARPSIDSETSEKF